MPHRKTADVEFVDHPARFEQWRQIERDWRGALTVGNVQLVLAEGSYTKLESSGMLEAVAAGVKAARDELRAEILRMAKDFPGAFLVPV